MAKTVLLTAMVVARVGASREKKMRSQMKRIRPHVASRLPLRNGDRSPISSGALRIRASKSHANTPPRSVSRKGDPAKPFLRGIRLDVQPFLRAKITALLIILTSKLYHWVLNILSPALGLDGDWENKALSLIDSLFLIVGFCLICCVLVLEVVKRIKSIKGE
jgi:hypothetical protein